MAEEAVASDQSVGTPITPAIISYQQNEANTFQKLGLVTSTLGREDRSSTCRYNKVLAKQAGLT